MYVAGFLFMSATEEQMSLVAGSAMDHVSYILILFSLASLMFLFVNILIHLWDRLSNSSADTKDMGGYTHVNGQVVEDGRVNDAQEFELDSLSSDDEGPGRRLFATDGDDSPTSTVGRNNETCVR